MFVDMELEVRTPNDTMKIMLTAKALPPKGQSIVCKKLAELAETIIMCKEDN